MFTSAFLLAPSVLSNEVAFVIASSDLLLKSLLLFVLARLLVRKGLGWLGNAGVYSVWLVTLACLMLIPLFSAQFSSAIAWSYAPAEQLNLLTIPLYQDLFQQAPVMRSSMAVWLQGLLFIYFTVLIYLLLGLWISLRQVARILQESESAEGERLQAVADRLAGDMVLRDPVQLYLSDEVEAPFSFYLRTPLMVLPTAARQWPAGKLERVLVHELSHIRRQDCRVLLGSQIATYLYWFNPLMWLVLKQLRSAAEFNCDDGVLSRGTSPVSYAEDLVGFARTIMDSRKRRCFAQYMIDARDIRQRVENIMQRKPVRHPFSPAAIFHGILLLLIALAVAMNTSIISTRYHDFVEASKLVYSESPVYPLTAYRDGVEGWVLVNFDIDNLGRVNRESIDIQFSQPSGVFEDVSLASLATFQFEAKRINGEAVPTSGLRYMFRYRLPNG